MNYLELLIKLFGQNSMSMNPVDIGQQIIAQLKKILMSLIILFICCVVFCLLMGYLVDRILTLMDQGTFYFSNSIIFLLILIVINIGTIVWALRKASAKEENSSKEKNQELIPMNSPLESAVAALIFDFIKERETKREMNSDNK